MEITPAWETMVILTERGAEGRREPEIQGSGAPWESGRRDAIPSVALGRLAFGALPRSRGSWEKVGAAGFPTTPSRPSRAANESRASATLILRIAETLRFAFWYSSVGLACDVARGFFPLPSFSPLLFSLSSPFPLLSAHTSPSSLASTSPSPHGLSLSVALYR